VKRSGTGHISCTQTSGDVWEFYQLNPISYQLRAISFGIKPHQLYPDIRGCLGVLPTKSYQLSATSYQLHRPRSSLCFHLSAL